MIPGSVVRHPLRALLRSQLLLLGVVVYGTAGYAAIERFSFLEALFMTVSTITTIGFGEARNLDAAGQVFTITLIAFGVAGFLYTFGVLVEQLSSGSWRDYRRHRRVDARLTALAEHVIVCGYGRTGAQVVRQLEEARTAYVVVEMNPTPLEAATRDRRLCVVGDAANDEVLRLAGIDRARALVSAVDSDERNVYIVLTARSLNPRIFIVARSSYPDSLAKLRRAGADRVVSPYTLSGDRMAALATQPALVDVIDMVMREGAHPMSIEELVVPADGDASFSAGRLRSSGATVLAVRSAAGALSVAPDDALPLEGDDVIVAMGTKEQLAALARLLLPAG